MIRAALVTLAFVVAPACERKNTDTPGLVEQTASDVETEIDQAGESVEGVADDVDETASDAVGE